uniref:DDE Tnp4 domain-containing protein n=1 Tax=Chenopodium quinoa TaxID=63459 RepID=A0A803KPA7_CHEQI
MEAIISLENEFLIQPDGTSIPSEIINNNRFYPYFKDCIGVIDGTHVRVKISDSNAPRYCGRKNWPTQNVLVACTFDLKFTYVLPRWEGLGVLLTLYRGVRYHLKEYSVCAPENAQELFNLRHASLRNAIKRAFGVLKKRFAIIAMSTDPDEELIAEVDRELLNSRRRPRRNAIDEDTEKGKIIRDNIAAQMWNAYTKPDAKKWMTTPIPFYEKLMDLYAKDRANGEGSLTAKERARQRSDNGIDSPPNNIETIDDLVSQNDITLEDFGCNNSPMMQKLGSSSASKSESKGESSSKGKKRKGSPDDDYEIQVLKEGLDSVSEAIREGNSILKQIRPQVYSSVKYLRKL